MSILSVDNISPIGSGTSVTVNSAATLVLTNANSTGVVTATTFSGSGASLTNLPAANLTGTLPAISGANLTGVLSNIVEDTSPQLGGTLDTNNQDITFNGAQNVSWDSSAADFIFNDYAKINLGTDKDFRMYQDGNNTILQSSNTSGGVYLQGALVQIGSETGEAGVKYIKDGAVELYHDNTKKFETASHGATFFGTSFHGDNIVSAFGDSSDLQLFHNGTDSFIKDVGTGALKVCSNLFRVNNAANTEAMIKAEENAGVTLSYDASTKFETMSTGARIQGGLLFNSDTAAANNLDDYEEGSWTPTSRNDGSFTSATGRYVKIGQQVTVWGYIPTVTNNTSNNLLQCSGLPFTVTSSGNTEMVGTLMIRFVTTVSGVNGVSFNVYANSGRNYVEFYGCRDDGNNYEAIKHSDLHYTNSNGIRFCLTYVV